MPYFTSKITKKYSIVLSYKPACFMLQQWSLKTLQRLKSSHTFPIITYHYDIMWSNDTWFLLQIVSCLKPIWNEKSDIMFTIFHSQSCLSYILSCFIFIPHVFYVQFWERPNLDVDILLVLKLTLSWAFRRKTRLHKWHH